MKNLTVLSLLLLLFLPPVAVAQKESANLVRNGDFEKFTGDNPDGWDTSNIPGTLTVVSSSKICKSGAQAVKCEVKDFFGSIVAGYVCQKNMATEGKDLRLAASFQVHSVGKDDAVIVLCFLNSAGSTLGTVEEYLDDSNSKWVEVSKQYKPPAGTAFAHVRLTILPGKGNEKAHPGSYLICDDLKLAAFVPAAPAEKPLIQ